MLLHHRLLTKWRRLALGLNSTATSLLLHISQTAILTDLLSLDWHGDHLGNQSVAKYIPQEEQIYLEVCANSTFLHHGLAWFLNYFDIQTTQT